MEDGKNISKCRETEVFLILKVLQRRRNEKIGWSEEQKMPEAIITGDSVN